MVLQSSGTISFLNLATEYGVTGQTPYNLDDFYKTVSSGNYTVQGGGIVGPTGSPNVPTTGQAISLGNFYAQKQRSTTLQSFPPSAMTAHTTVIGGDTYRSISDSERTATLNSWKAFNKNTTSGTYGAWQSSDGRFSNNIGNVVTSINGFTPPSYRGCWIGLTLPAPIFLHSFETAGPAVDFRLYASQNPSDTSSWDMVHEVTGSPGIFVDILTHTLSAVTTKPYICFVIFINKVNGASTAGFGRGGMNEITFKGYRA